MKNYLFPTYFITFVICIGLSGCTTEKRIDFSSVDYITGEKIEEITFFSKGNVYLAVADTFLVIQRNEEPNIRIYSTNTHELLSEFGTVGNGPGEFQRPSLNKFTDIDLRTGSPILYLFDYRRQEISYFRIHDVFDGNIEISQNKLPSQTFLTFFHYINDSLYVGTPATLNRFYINNFKADKDTLIPFIPKPDFQIPVNTLPAVYRTVTAVNEDLGILAAAPLFFGEINFFDLDGNFLRSAMWQNKDQYQEELISGLRTFSNIQYQIVDMDSYRGLIFGLNQNNSVIEFDRDELENNMKVQVVDWDGEPVKEYVLEGKTRFTTFAVDSIHQRFYAYSPDQPDHTIFMFDFD